MKDWIDLGSFPVYPLWLGTSAQSGLPSGHPIVEESGHDGVHIVDQECGECAGLWGYTLWSVIRSQVYIPVSLLDIPVHNLGCSIRSFSFPEKTPEESDDSQHPHENRPNSDILEHINDHFSPVFTPRDPVWDCQHLLVTPGL